MDDWRSLLPPPTEAVKIFGIDPLNAYLEWIDERVNAREFSTALHSLEAIPQELKTNGLTLVTGSVWVKWAMVGEKGIPPAQPQREVALKHAEAMLAGIGVEEQNSPTWFELQVTLARARNKFSEAIQYLNRWVECTHDVRELDQLSQLTTTIELDRVVWETPNPLSYTPETHEDYLRALDALQAQKRYRDVVRSLEAIPKAERDYTLTLRLARAWLSLAVHELRGQDAYALNAVLRTFNYLKPIEVKGVKDPRWLETTVLAFRVLGHEVAVNDFLNRWEALGPDEDDRRRIMALRNETFKRPSFRERSK